VDLYPDEDIAEILRAAFVEAPPDFGHQIRIWEVIVLGMIAYQQDRRARENNSRAKKSRTPKEKTAARDALDDLESKLKAAAEALRELPMLAEETMLKERMLGRDRLRLELLTGIDHVQKAKKQIAVQGGGPQGQPVLNGQSPCSWGYASTPPAAKSRRRETTGLWP
jgi:hypothetical protein